MRKLLPPPLRLKRLPPLKLLLRLPKKLRLKKLQADHQLLLLTTKRVAFAARFCF
jgi:hypothetical protein